MALKRNQGGFTLVETLVVLFIVTLLVSMGGVWAQRYSEHQLVTAVAEHQKAVAGATSHFIRDNYPAVLNRATAGPLTLGIHELIAQGLLPTGFSPTNAFKQYYRIIVIKPQANQLKTMIVTDNGEVIEERILRKIVRHLGASGGRISDLDAEGKPNAALVGVVQGADEGWQEPLSPYGVSPGVGHLASAIFHQDGQEVENYLHRKAIPGKPELNRMQTHLDMGGHDINSVKAIKSQSAELAGWLTAEGAQLRGALNAKDATLSGNLSAKTAGVADRLWANSLTGNSATVHGHLSANSLETNSAKVHGNIDSGSTVSNWIESRGGMRSNARLSTKEYLQIEGVAQEGTWCAPAGLIAHNGAGSLLTCESNVWRRAGGKTPRFDKIERFAGTTCKDNQVLVGLSSWSYAGNVRPQSGTSAICVPYD